MNRRISLLGIVAAVVVLCVHGTGRSQDHKWMPHTPITSVPMYGKGQFFAVKIKVADRPMIFEIDTGAGTSVFADKHENLLRPINESESSSELTLYRPPQMILGDYTLPLERVLKLPHKGAETVQGLKTDGILGLDAFRQAAIRFDLSSDRFVVFHRSKHDTPPGISHRVSWTEHGCPQLMAKLGNAVDVPLIVDTGCQGLNCLDDVFASKLVGSGQMKVSGAALLPTTEGPKFHRCGRVKTISLGECQYRDMVFYSRKGDSSRLGTPFLSRFNMTLDLVSEILWLESRECAQEWDHSDVDGLVLVKDKGDGLMVLGVHKDGIGLIAGVVPKDVIVDVRGKHSGDKVKGVEIIQFLMSRCGEPAILNLRRGGKSIEIELPTGGRQGNEN